MTSDTLEERTEESNSDAETSTENPAETSAESMNLQFPEEIDENYYDILMQDYKQINADNVKCQLQYGNNLFRKAVDGVFKKNKANKITLASKRCVDSRNIASSLGPMLESFHKNLNFYQNSYLRFKANKEKNIEVLSNTAQAFDHLKIRYDKLFPEEDISIRQQIKDGFFKIFGKNRKRDYSEVSRNIVENDGLVYYLLEGKDSEQQEKIMAQLQDPEYLYFLDTKMASDIRSLEKQVRMGAKKFKFLDKSIEDAEKKVKSTTEHIEKVKDVMSDMNYSHLIYGAYATLGSRTAFG